MAHASSIHTYADYGSYIHVHNKTSVDIALDDSGAEEGEWAKGSPPNTIEAGGEGIVHLKDTLGFDGSKGFVVYELYTPKANKRVTVRLDFADPYSATDDNYLYAKSSKPNQVSVNVLSYQNKGHPFTAHVEIYLAGDDDYSDSVEAQFKIGFDTIGGLLHWQPVHEEIAIAAFIRSNLHFPRAPHTTISTQSSGITPRHGQRRQRRSQYDQEKHPYLARSHVQARSWQGVNERDLLCDKLPGSFKASTSGNQTLRDLLLGNTPEYRKADISHRALGVCLHMIQDSYAVGHTLRRLKNPNDLAGRDKDGYVTFLPNTHAQLGPLITFHTYLNQSSRHDHYDDSDSDDLSPRDLNSFNKIIGARDAIDKCTTLINFFAAKTRWDDGVREFLDNEVYELDQRVTRSNAQVDERFGLPDTCGVLAVEKVGDSREGDEEYTAGLERKMLMLEGGLAYTQHRQVW
ncbi:hypothetical protein A1F99_142160 [Pyrenophora tritici-repentis]|nr:hypothetical protein A1F99_142160 [Pyrenophora tritici-repentis]